MDRLNLALINTQLMLAKPFSTDLRKRDERGAINTIEILLIIAVVIVIVAALGVGLKAYVQAHMPK